MGRLILLDRRGVGLSDRVGFRPSVEATAQDIRTVLDAAGSRRVVLFGASEGGPACIKFAADHPDRVAGLILFASLAKGSATPDYPHALHAGQYDAWLQQLVSAWGGPAGIETFAPSLAGDAKARAWWAGLLRAASSPGAIKGVLEALRDTDVRHLLGRVAVPTLVLHRRGDRAVRIGAGRHLANHIPQARFIELDGADHWVFAGDRQAVLVASGGSSAISRNNVVRFLIKRGARKILMRTKSHTATPTAALALGLLFTPPASIAADAIIGTVASLAAAAVGTLGFISPAMAEPAALTKKQSDALNTYNNSRSHFEPILAQRRAQINSDQPLPNLPGQALYLARNNMMSAYKDLTDALPSKIGGPNKYGIPPAYFSADNEPLLDEYRRLFDIMQAPPANAQKSDTPFKDVVDLGTAIARAKGLDAANAEVGGPHQPRAVLCRDQWQSEHRQCALQQIQGQFPDRRIRGSKRAKEMGRDKKSIAAFDPH